MSNPVSAEGEIAQVSADGAYDSHGCHATIAERGPVVPPFPLEKVPSLGEMTIPVMRSSRRLRPMEAATGRTRAATIGAASRRT